MAKKRGTKAGINSGKELVAAFRQIGRDVENELEQSLVRCGLFVERDAKINAPVDTGRLRASITHRITTEGNDSIVEVGTNVEYAPAVEFGTSKKSANPFLFPAFHSNKNKIINELAKALKKGAGL